MPFEHAITPLQSKASKGQIMENGENEMSESSPKRKKRPLANGKQAREEKRRKWETKQARKLEKEAKEKSRAAWFESNSHFATFVTEEDVDSIKPNNSEANSKDSAPKQLESLLLPYFDIQDKPIKELLNSGGGKGRFFVAEGTETIRILIQQHMAPRHDGLKPITLQSIFVKPSLLFDDPVNLLADVKEAFKIRESNNTVAGKDSPCFHVLVGSEAALSRVAGFPVSRGALACGMIPEDRDELWLDSLLDRRLLTDRVTKQIRLLALDGVCDTANLGSMIRCASAFGIDAIVVSQDTCESWYRRSIRVSMGHVFKVPVVRVNDLACKLQAWKELYPELCSFAAVIDTDNLLEKIPRGQVSNTWCCVMGNEGQGVSQAVSDACTQRLRIEMSHDVDSLSVPIACGIMLHGLKERETKL